MATRHMTRTQRIDDVIGSLEMVCIRFAEQQEKTGNRHYGSHKNGHTELADAFAWAVAALNDALPLLKKDSPQRIATTDRMTRYCDALTRIFGPEEEPA